MGQTTATISNLVPGDYTCLISYPGLCSTDSLTVTVVDGQPTVVPMSATTICIGQSVSLTATGSGGASGFTYSWTSGGTPVSANVSPVVTTTYSVIATDATGCSSTPSTVTIDVNPPLSVLTTNATAICESSSAPLSSTASGGNGNFTYSWSPATGLNDPTISNPIASP